MNKDHWYKRDKKKYIIDLKVNSLDQLFDKRDPNPYRIKDLDDDVVEYIVSSSQDIGKNKIACLRILFVLTKAEIEVIEVAHAISEYFEYRKQISEKNLKSILVIGLKSLVIGLLFLSLAIYISKNIAINIEDHYIKNIIKEGSLLLGWVSMWKPVNIFLYEWWPIKENISLFRTLSTMKVSILKDTEEEP